MIRRTMKQINLIPPEYAYSRYLRRRITIWLKLTVAIGAMIGALGFSLYRSADGAEKEHKRLQARAAAFKQISADLHAVAADKRVITEKLKDIYATWRERRYSVILSDIAAACNDRVFLTELTVGAESRPPKGCHACATRTKPRPSRQKKERRSSSSLVLRSPIST